MLLTGERRRSRTPLTKERFVKLTGGDYTPEHVDEMCEGLETAEDIALHLETILSEEMKFAMGEED